MSDFETVMRGYRKDRVLLVDPTGGNVGDDLIRLGTVKLFTDLRLDYEVKRAPWESLQHRFLGDRWGLGGYDLVVLRGGGYVNDVWRGGRGMVRTLSEYSRDFIIAPQSCWMAGNGKLRKTLEEMPRLSWFFLREQYSHDAIKDMKLGFSVGLSHDCIFYLSREDLERMGSVSVGNGSLFYFRNDAESAVKRSLLNNVKPSQMRTILGYVGAVMSCREVNTDVLHVACVGAILGRRVNLYGNSYWKNRGVYEYSLRGYPGVEFRGEGLK